MHASSIHNKRGLSVVIPAYNEAERIGPTLESISGHLKARGIDYEIVVVNDGSTDLTVDIVETYGRKDGCVRLISYHPNRGKGCAVRKGVLSAGAQDVLISDADLATPIEDLEKLEKAARNDFDVVIGSRALKDSEIKGWRPWYRELSGKVFNSLVRLLAVPEIRDTQCGFKLFRHGSAAKIFSVARLDGFGFDVEALYLARKFGYRIAEIGIRWSNSPSTKVSVLRDTLPMLLEVIRIRLNDWKKLYESPAAND